MSQSPLYFFPVSIFRSPEMKVLSETFTMLVQVTLDSSKWPGDARTTLSRKCKTMHIRKLETKSWSGYWRKVEEWRRKRSLCKAWLNQARFCGHTALFKFATRGHLPNKNGIRSFIRQKQKDTAYKDLEKVSLLNYGLFLKTETVEKQGDEGTELFCFVLFFSKMHKI